MSVHLKTEEDIAVLRESGKILAALLRTLKSEAKAGTKLSELDALARRFAHDAGAEPTFLNYRPEGAHKAYPASICASINDVVVHGIPGKHVLKEGDLLKIDAGITYRGYVTDSAITVPIGKPSAAIRKLIEISEEALERGIAECVPGNRLGDIGYAIEATLRKGGLSVIQGLTGHGVGFHLHEDPDVPNYGDRGVGMKIVSGLVVAIEPMACIGSGEIVQLKDDSYATEDGSLASHVEHTVAVLAHGNEVLTR